ncbi:hypothetical protein EDB85DRAFT_1888743 [Lactarius pseudohatsudake]|nr:hypothetical protein EDB85DRAFT_1888743 [Lactarius pseudohatsudake]
MVTARGQSGCGESREQRQGGRERQAVRGQKMAIQRGWQGQRAAKIQSGGGKGAESGSGDTGGNADGGREDMGDGSGKDPERVARIREGAEGGSSGAESSNESAEGGGEGAERQWRVRRRGADSAQTASGQHAGNADSAQTARQCVQCRQGVRHK